MQRPTRVALALGAGGARGYAHIGVIDVLEERGYEIVSIAGTSMGAVIGGLHAAGRLGAYADWVRSLNQRDVLRLLDPSLTAPGAIRADKIVAKVSDLLGGAVIEQLPIAYTAVATDLLAGKEVWFQQGPVDAAIRASIALPSFIAPVMLNGRLLVDGGLLNPIPVAATAASSADLTIAVSLSDAPFTSPGTAPVHATSEPLPREQWPDRLRRPAAQLLDHDLMRTLAGWLNNGRDTAQDDPDAASADEETDQLSEQVFGEPPPGMRTLDVMRLSLEALQSVVTRYRLAGNPPDLLITIPKTSCRTLDFHRAEEMIALGRERTTAALDRPAPVG